MDVSSGQIFLSKKKESHIKKFSSDQKLAQGQ